MRFFCAFFLSVALHARNDFRMGPEGRGLTGQFCSYENPYCMPRDESKLRLRLAGGRGEDLPSLELLPFDDRVLISGDEREAKGKVARSLLPKSRSFELPALWSDADDNKKTFPPVTEGRRDLRKARLVKNRKGREERLDSSPHFEEEEEEAKQVFFSRRRSSHEEVELFGEPDGVEDHGQVDDSYGSFEGDGDLQRQRRSRSSQAREAGDYPESGHSNFVGELAPFAEPMKDQQETPRLFFKKGKLRVVNWRGGERKHQQKGKV